MQFTGIETVLCLRRKKNTKSQAKLSPADRLSNIKDAFAARPEYTVKDKRIILVDDVSTSGATLDAAGRALRDTGAAEVYGFRAAWT